MDNVYIRGLTFQNIKGIFTTPLLSNYAPFHIISYSIDYILWGLNPKGYHLTNVLLHGLNGCAAYAVTGRITGHKGIAFTASFLFVIHPLGIENVAWISERKSLLATFFLFLSMICYMNFRYKGSPGFYLSGFILFILAILSKASAVILPLILAAHEVIFNRDNRKLSPLLPLFLISFAGAALEVWAHIDNKSIEHDIISVNFLFGTVYPTMLPVFWKYVSLILWPFNLSGYYDTTLYHSFLEPPVIVSLSAWVLVLIFVCRKGRPQALFWFLWFWICLLPVSNIIPIPVYYADRYMYTPALAFFVLFGAVAKKLWDIKAYSAKKISYAIVAVTMIFYSLASFTRMDVWRNELVFWEDTVKKSPHQYKAHLNLGLAYEKNGRLADAEREYIATVTVYGNEEAVSALERIRTKIRLNRELKIYK